MRSAADGRPACVTDDLEHAARVELSVWDVPAGDGPMWRGLHGVAGDVARRLDADYRHALAAVMWVASATISAEYGGQSMVRAICAAHEAGALAEALRRVAGA